MDRPLRADAARNRERILDAARLVFAERGLAASLDDVARAAGVGIGTVYRRFGDKDALVDALFTARVDEAVERAFAAAESPDAWAGLVGFLEAAVHDQVRDRGLKDVLLSTDRGRARLLEHKGRMVTAVGALVARCHRDGVLRPDVAATDLACTQVMLTALTERMPCAAPDLYRRYLAVLLDGLRADAVPRVALPVPAPQPGTLPLGLSGVPSPLVGSLVG